MSSELIKKTVALAAAASTTLVLFSAVVKIAEKDKVALAEARSVRTTKLAAAVVEPAGQVAGKAW